MSHGNSPIITDHSDRFPIQLFAGSTTYCQRSKGSRHWSRCRRHWSSTMPTTLESAVAKYLRSGNPAQRTREEYATTLRKWVRWGGAVPIDQLGRKEIREFLDWVYEDAATQEGTNPGRTANKVRSHLRALMSWAWSRTLLMPCRDSQSSSHSETSQEDTT